MGAAAGAPVADGFAASSVQASRRCRVLGRTRLRTVRGGCAGVRAGYLPPREGPRARRARTAGPEQCPRRRAAAPPPGRRWPGPKGHRGQAAAAWPAWPGAGLPSLSAPSATRRAVRTNRNNAVPRTWPADPEQPWSPHIRTSKLPPLTCGRPILNIDE